jgi:xanthine dehydrogenase accessory factor
MVGREMLNWIANRSSEGEPVAIITRIMGDGRTEKLAISSNGRMTDALDAPSLFGQAIDHARKLLAGKGSATVIELRDERGLASTFVIEAVRPRPSLLIFGAGHVGQAVALIGAMLGYRVVVIDDRAEFLTRNRLPDPRIELDGSGFQEGVPRDDITATTAVVIVTRGHQYDEVCLKNVLRSGAAYIGMIGSRRRVLAIFRKLENEGVERRYLDRIHAPIGLGIGARSPQEIAVAIVAQIISVLNRHDKTPTNEQR